MESAGELAWFRAEVVRSIVRPRAFARSLAREHFGLAGLLVVIGAGIALSLTGGSALQFRFVDPPDVDASFAQATAIAATWHIAAPPP